jgi:hypothetical protein
MTVEEFEIAYAERSHVTVEFLHAHGRFGKPCACGEDDCEGWQMAHTVEDEWFAQEAEKQRRRLKMSEQRTREEILKTLDDAHAKTVGGPGQGAIDREQRDVTIELLLDIREGVSYMVESQKRYDQQANAQREGKLPPR